MRKPKHGIIKSTQDTHTCACGETFSTYSTALEHYETKSKPRKKKVVETQTQAERNKGPEYEINDRGHYTYAKTTEQLLWARRDLELKNGLDDLEIEDILELIDEVVGRRDTMRVENENIVELEAERDEALSRVAEIEKERDELIRRLDEIETNRDNLREQISEVLSILR